MNQRLVRIGLHIINLNALANCHWEGRKLVVRYLGGGYEMLEGKNAQAIWSVVSRDVPVIQCDAPPEQLSRSDEAGTVLVGDSFTAESCGQSSPLDLRPAV